MATWPARPLPAQVGAWAFVESQTLASAASSVVMSGLDTTYRMFRVTAYLIKDGTSGDLGVRLNNDSGNNYNYQVLAADGSTPSATRTAIANAFTPMSSSMGSNGIASLTITVAKQRTTSPAMFIANAAQNSGSLATSRTGGRWNDGSKLISRIDLISSSGNFAAGTSVKLEAA